MSDHVVTHERSSTDLQPGADTEVVPLCVDLDGTLVRSDTLIEGVLALATDRDFFSTALLLLKGRAAFKHRVAEIAPFHPELLPYNEDLLDYLRAEKAAGRRLVLATAANIRIAIAVADHLGLFDEVIASDAARNLKGTAKARALVERFGAKGFDYVGNCRSDLPIWTSARHGILVNAPAGVARAARGVVSVVAEFQEAAGATRRALVRAARPHQWAKNLLVFVPVVTGHALFQPEALFGALLAFLAFSATASAIYVYNDLLDLTADRKHHRKRLRPFAKGDAPLFFGVGFGLLLLVLGTVCGWLAGALPIILCYAAMSTAYSVKLKEMPLLDVFILAALYTVRMVGGGEASGYPVSLWLLGFSGFLFLSLALVKRVEELMASAREQRRSLGRRAYSTDDLPILQTFGCASSFSSGVVLALFVQSDGVQPQHYASPTLLWATVPLVLFWQCRLWLSTARGYMHDDPIIYAARDWVSWLVVAALVMILLVAKSGIGLP